jgi:Glycosyl transferase family group 2
MVKLHLLLVTMREFPSSIARLYKSLRYSTRFLRWKAFQDAAFTDSTDGQSKIWSESNVSEDFDMAMRLQAKGYIIRFDLLDSRMFACHLPPPRWVTFGGHEFYITICRSVRTETLSPRILMKLVMITLSAYIFATKQFLFRGVS